VLADSRRRAPQVCAELGLDAGVVMLSLAAEGAHGEAATPLESLAQITTRDAGLNPRAQLQIWPAVGRFDEADDVRDFMAAEADAERQAEVEASAADDAQLAEDESARIAEEAVAEAQKRLEEEEEEKRLAEEEERLRVADAAALRTMSESASADTARHAAEAAAAIEASVDAARLAEDDAAAARAAALMVRLRRTF
jgi:hypothetical protein